MKQFVTQSSAVSHSECDVGSILLFRVVFMLTKSTLRKWLETTATQ